jgi:catechol 2,3-dioxygenase-like lactoylglutathione lyase family enzyme
MFDHVTIRVPDRGAARQLFDTVLTPLGLDTSYDGAAFTMWRDFIVTQTDADHPVTCGAHLAFAAPSREQVDDFWEAGGAAAGVEGESEPGARPDRGDRAYGATLRAPSGNRFEALFTGARRPPESAIDHLVLGVADLGAATAFYAIVGASAGFALDESGPDGATFTGPAGGWLRLVPGPATEHLHVAFPGDDAGVQRFHADAVAAGHPSNGVPGERSQYHPGYYAAYVLDPDGNNIEIVDHHLS